MSENASGTICKNITFSLRKSGQQVRFQNKQKDKITSARSAHRLKYQEAVTAWNLLTPTQKSAWTRNAKGQNITGFNLYISIFLNEYAPPIELSFYGQAIYGEAIYGNF